MVNWHPFFGTIWHPNCKVQAFVFLMCRSNLKKGRSPRNRTQCEMYQEVASHSPNLSGRQFPQTCTLWCHFGDFSDIVARMALASGLLRGNNALPQHSNCGRWKVFGRLFLNQIWRFKLKKWIKIATPFSVQCRTFIVVLGFVGIISTDLSPPEN